MQKREVNVSPRIWAKPEVRRMVTGLAELGGDTSVDGSASYS